MKIKEKTKNMLDKVSIGVAVVGGLNWGLVGLFSFNLVETVLKNNFYARLVYVVVGLSSGYLGYRLVKKAKF